VMSRPVNNVVLHNVDVVYNSEFPYNIKAVLLLKYIHFSVNS